jgi:hypothetical protein
VTTDLFGHATLPLGASPKRGKPYLWVTWLTGLLAGEDACYMQSWLKAHYRFEERADRSFDLEAWKAEHTAMVEFEVARQQQQGWRVTLEDQNKFTYEGQAALVGGKPDIIAYRDGLVKVIDCKGGKRRASDYQQVLLYLFFLPRIAKMAPANLLGEVIYRPDVSNPVCIQPTEVTAEWIARMSVAVRKVAGGVRPETVPSARECHFCKVPDALCPDRAEAPPELYGQGEEF